MTDQATTWTGKLALTQIPYRLCPNLQRRYIRATMIGTRMKALPASVVAWLPICAEKFAAKETARLVTEEGGASISPERLAEIEGIAKERALAQAEQEARGMYRKLADKLRCRRSQRVVQAIADDEHFRVTGRRGDLLADPIPAHLAMSLQVDARTVSLPRDGDSDQGAVWRDVFVSCTPAKRKRGNRSYKDAALVAEVRAALKSGQARSLYGAAFDIADRIPGAGTPESRARRIAKAAAKS